MNPIQQHWQSAEQEFERRMRWQKLANRFPSAIRKQAAKWIWNGGFKHLRRFDHRYTFERNEQGLSSMAFNGQEIIKSVSVRSLIGRIDRPVTLATSGPSALEYDWEALRTSGRMIVGVTGGATFLRERGITPDLLILSDPDFSKTGGFHIRDAVGIPLVVEYRSAASLHTYFPETFVDRPVSLIERVNKWYGIPALSNAELANVNEQSGSPFLISDVPDKLGRIGWSDQMDLGFYPSSTVAFVALQTLVSLGAKDIEIVGMDLGGSSSIYANARPSKLQEQYQDIIFPSFQSMRRALNGRDISIKNLSPTCPLPPDIFQFQ
jgi:KDO transferase-3